MARVPADHICRSCGEENLDTEACFNAGDWCVECCAKSGGCCYDPVIDGPLPDQEG